MRYLLIFFLISIIVSLIISLLLEKLLENGEKIDEGFAFCFWKHRCTRGTNEMK